MRLNLLFVGFIFILVGCGGEHVASVSGKITLDKKPLANATVTFQPTATKGNPGPGSTGKTNDNGEYTLYLNTNKDVKGAVLGEHKVMISLIEGEAESSGANPKPRADKVPQEYNVHSGLKFEVKAEGNNTADFELNTAAKMPK